MTAIAEAFVKVTADTSGVAGQIEQGASKDIEKTGKKVSGRFGKAFRNSPAMHAIGLAAGQIVGTAIGIGIGKVIDGSAADGIGRLGQNLNGLAGGLAAVGVGAGGLAVVAQSLDGVSAASDLLASSTGVLSAAKGFFIATTDAETGAVTASGLSHVRATIAVVAHRAAEIAAAAAAKAMAAAQWLVNAALTANPIGLVVAGLALLVGGFILAYKKSETFRNIVKGAMGIARDAIGWVITKGEQLVDFFVGLPGRISRATRGLWDGLKDSFRSAVNWIIDKWNNFHLTIGGGSVLGQKLPSVTLNTPDIPHLAAGGIVRARPGGMLARIGEGRYDEAVIPLKRGMGVGGLTINGGITVVSGPNEAAEHSLPRALRNLAFTMGY